jgi:hypothetical protein
VFIRDGFTCGFRCRWTLPPGLLRLVSAAFETEYPYIDSWQRAIAPRAYWDICTSLDHFMPVSAFQVGGAFQSPENLLTACYRCKQQKSNTPLTSLGWEVRARAVDG